MLAGLTVLGVVFAFDLILYEIGTQFNLGFSSADWGTYAAWASAVFPGMALMVTAYSWILDRHDRERREVMAWASMIDRRNGTSNRDTTITNNSSQFVRIAGDSVGALRDHAVVCKPGETKYFSSSQGAIKLEINGHQVHLGSDCSVTYLGPM